MNRNEKGQFMPKGEMSVYDATLLAYNSQPPIFHGVTFVIDVRLILNRPMCPDGTIFRELRFLEADGLIKYTVLNSELSIYKKEPLKAEA